MKRILIVPLALLFLAGSALASPLCATAGLDVYVGTYNTPSISNACQIGDKLFYDFQYSVTTGTAPIGTITITPDPGDGVTNPGLQITSGSFTVLSGSLDATITYSVATLSGSAVLEDYSLLLNGTHRAGFPGYGTVTETFTSPEGTSLVTGYGPGTATNPFQHVAFTPYIDGTTVTTEIQEYALPNDAGQPDHVSISLIQENFSETLPEPYAAVLIGSGLVLLGLRRKKRAA
jgi:hypothetical protein